MVYTTSQLSLDERSLVLKKFENDSCTEGLYEMEFKHTDVFFYIASGSEIIQFCFSDWSHNPPLSIVLCLQIISAGI